nr:unnamed protein product [Callosobruchus chinensis]
MDSTTTSCSDMTPNAKGIPSRTSLSSLSYQRVRPRPVLNIAPLNFEEIKKAIESEDSMTMPKKPGKNADNKSAQRSSLSKTMDHSSKPAKTGKSELGVQPLKSVITSVESQSKELTELNESPLTDWHPSDNVENDRLPTKEVHIMVSECDAQLKSDLPLESINSTLNKPEPVDMDISEETSLHDQLIQVSGKVPSKNSDQQVEQEFIPFSADLEETVDIQVKENIPPKSLVDDSFDLNFSALTISTPAKKSTEHLFVTPKVSAPSCKDAQKSSISYKVALKVSNSACKTPAVSSCPQSNGSSVTRRCLYTIPQSPPKDETFATVFVNSVPYVILNVLGKGGSSEVYLCLNQKNKTLVAVKSVSLKNTMSAQGYIKEIELLHKLQTCDRIIKMYDYELIQSEQQLYIVLEKGGDDLAKILKNMQAQHDHLPVYMILFYWMEMLYAVHQIHENGVIHADLKPANFLRAGSGLKLIDFGIASSVQTDMTSATKLTQEGTQSYISPEALNCDTTNPSSPKYKLHFKSDVWSLGCILYQLIYKVTPFPKGGNIWATLATVMNPNYKVDYPKADWIPPLFIETIQRCLQHDIKSRPTAAQLIQEYELMFGK